MPLRFTPAALRALSEAAAWRDAFDDEHTAMPSLLLGVLGESESRAADILRQHAVTADAVLAHWPDLNRRYQQNGQPQLDEQTAAASFRARLRGVEELLFDFPRPIEIATEHLLLGLLVSQEAVAVWLTQHGLSADALAADIRRWHGLELDAASPIEMPEEQTVDDAIGEPAPVEPMRGEMERTDVPVLRILDASANRAREGMRVVEDFARFVLDDAQLCRRLKEFRHDLAQACAGLPALGLLRARDTEQDVGTAITTAAEQHRSEPAQVALANWKRVQEALRSLEEYGKLLSSELGSAFEQLRYRSYTLEQAMALTADRRPRLMQCRLYVLIDGREDAESFSALASMLIEAGVHILQLRDKRLDDRALLARAELLREQTRDSDTLLIVNDRPDIARLAKADGVHLGQEELSVVQARSICGSQSLVGTSTHNVQQARQAVLDGADYIGVGPTFPSRTKTFSQFTGTQLLREIAGEISLPAFAIGGITLQNLDEVLAAGFTRVAVSGAIVDAPQPAQAAREFLRRLTP